jgi:hypothetical protein
MASASEAIEKVVWTYLDGLSAGDTRKPAAAFHAQRHLYALSDGGLSHLPREEWLAFVENRASAKVKGLKRTDRIVSIDLSGPETACVKLECSIHPRYCTDYLPLLKLQGGWRVVCKTFRTQVRE